MTDDLRQRIADAIRAAVCEGGCGSTEEECRTRRLQPVVWHFDTLAEVDGTPEQIADALLPLFAAEREAAADAAEDVANELFAAYDTEQGNGAMAVAARLRARTGCPQWEAS